MYVGVRNDWCVRETDLNSNFLCSPVGNCQGLRAGGELQIFFPEQRGAENLLSLPSTLGTRGGGVFCVVDTKTAYVMALPTLQANGSIPFQFLLLILLLHPPLPPPLNSGILGELSVMVQGSPSVQDKLGPALLHTYAAVSVVEGLDVDKENFDKYATR